MTDLDDLLEWTSRTFALAIPFLAEPLRRQVALAYLLFRIADTLEDAALWDRATRAAALHHFASLLKDPSEERCRALAELWLSRPPCHHTGYLKLLDALAAVLDALAETPESARNIIRAHLLRTVDGMLARDTLVAVERAGPGAKLSRSEVAEILAILERDLGGGA